MDASRLIQYTGHEYDILLDDNGSASLYDISGRWMYCGEVPTYSALPTDAQEGDMYTVAALNVKYFWNGDSWETMGDATVAVPVDGALSTTSTNPVQNKIITNKINELVTKDTDQDDRLDDLEDTLETGNFYKDSSWNSSNKKLTFTKSDGSTKSHTIDVANGCYNSSTWDATNRNLTLTKMDGTSTVHNITAGASDAGVLTFVTTDGTTVTKTVTSSASTPYKLIFELSDGTLVEKTIVATTTG